MMKKLAALGLGLFLIATYSAPGEVTEADKKWLNVAQTMIAEGQTKVSTPSETRANLLKDWCTQKGYKAALVKDGSGFSIELRKDQVAANR